MLKCDQKGTKTPVRVQGSSQPAVVPLERRKATDWQAWALEHQFPILGNHPMSNQKQFEKDPGLPN